MHSVQHSDVGEDAGVGILLFDAWILARSACFIFPVDHRMINAKHLQVRAAENAPGQFVFNVCNIAMTEEETLSCGNHLIALGFVCAVHC